MSKEAIKINLLIGYDISDDKIRAKVFKELKYFGLINIQYSVFYGEDISKNIFNLIKIMFTKLEIENYFIAKVESKNIEGIPLLEEVVIM
ncbi:CRISPR-associated endonuclease Cas2 [Streptobacillus canis]|uniref:CRISPR-associated endonuclease Cas2 n=1 Tax=Streptobacillus canis TaxID=2678686 RepID=UPI0012E25134|nr:CRISPR-associated endonuclease Cas2 [Streptobacillus canis]